MKRPNVYIKRGIYFPHWTHKLDTRLSFDDFSVLASGRSELDTIIRETMLIAKINPFLNVNVKSFPLMSFLDIYIFPLSS